MTLYPNLYEFFVHQDFYSISMLASKSHMSTKDLGEVLFSGKKLTNEQILNLSQVLWVIPNSALIYNNTIMLSPKRYKHKVMMENLKVLHKSIKEVYLEYRHLCSRDILLYIRGKGRCDGEFLPASFEYGYEISYGAYLAVKFAAMRCLYDD